MRHVCLWSQQAILVGHHYLAVLFFASERRYEHPNSMAICSQNIALLATKALPDAWRRQGIYLFFYAARLQRPCIYRFSGPVRVLKHLMGFVERMAVSLRHERRGGSKRCMQTTVALPWHHTTWYGTQWHELMYYGTMALCTVRAQ